MPENPEKQLGRLDKLDKTKDKKISAIAGKEDQLTETYIKKTEKLLIKTDQELDQNDPHKEKIRKNIHDFLAEVDQTNLEAKEQDFKTKVDDFTENVEQRAEIQIQLKAIDETDWTIFTQNPIVYETYHSIIEQGKDVSLEDVIALVDYSEQILPIANEYQEEIRFFSDDQEIFTYNDRTLENYLGQKLVADVLQGEITNLDEGVKAFKTQVEGIKEKRKDVEKFKQYLLLAGQSQVIREVPGFDHQIEMTETINGWKNILEDKTTIINMYEFLVGKKGLDISTIKARVSKIINTPEFAEFLKTNPKAEEVAVFLLDATIRNPKVLNEDIKMRAELHAKMRHKESLDKYTREKAQVRIKKNDTEAKIKEFFEHYLKENEFYAGMKDYQFKGLLKYELEAKRLAERELGLQGYAAFNEICYKVSINTIKTIKTINDKSEETENIDDFNNIVDGIFDCAGDEEPMKSIKLWDADEDLYSNIPEVQKLTGIMSEKRILEEDREMAELILSDDGLRDKELRLRTARETLGSLDEGASDLAMVKKQSELKINYKEYNNLEKEINKASPKILAAIEEYKTIQNAPESERILLAQKNVTLLKLISKSVGLFEKIEKTNLEMNLSGYEAYAMKEDYMKTLEKNNLVNKKTQVKIETFLQMYSVEALIKVKKEKINENNKTQKEIELKLPEINKTIKKYENIKNVPKVNRTQIEKKAKGLLGSLSKQTELYEQIIFIDEKITLSGERGMSKEKKRSLLERNIENISDLKKIGRFSNEEVRVPNQSREAEVMIFNDLNRKHNHTIGEAFGNYEKNSKEMSWHFEQEDRYVKNVEAGITPFEDKMKITMVDRLNRGIDIAQSMKKSVQDGRRSITTLRKTLMAEWHELNKGQSDKEIYKKHPELMKVRKAMIWRIVKQLNYALGNQFHRNTVEKLDKLIDKFEQAKNDMTWDIVKTTIVFAVAVGAAVAGGMIVGACLGKLAGVGGAVGLVASNAAVGFIATNVGVATGATLGGRLGTYGGNKFARGVQWATGGGEVTDWEIDMSWEGLGKDFARNLALSMFFSGAGRLIGRTWGEEAAKRIAIRTGGRGLSPGELAEAGIGKFALLRRMANPFGKFGDPGAKRAFTWEVLEEGGQEGVETVAERINPALGGMIAMVNGANGVNIDIKTTAETRAKQAQSMAKLGVEFNKTLGQLEFSHANAEDFHVDMITQLGKTNDQVTYKINDDGSITIKIKETFSEITIHSKAAPTEEVARGIEVDTDPTLDTQTNDVDSAKADQDTDTTPDTTIDSSKLVDRAPKITSDMTVGRIKAIEFVYNIDTQKKIDRVVEDLENVPEETKQKLREYIEKNALAQHEKNPEQYVSHGFDHTLNVMGHIENAMENDPEIVQTMMSKYGITEAEAKFMMKMVAVFHDFGYPDVGDLGKALHGVTGALIAAKPEFMEIMEEILIKNPADKAKFETLMKDFQDAILFHSADKVEVYRDTKIKITRGEFIIDSGNIVEIISEFNKREDLPTDVIEIHCSETKIAEMERVLMENGLSSDNIKFITIEENVKFKGRVVDLARKKDKKLGIEFKEASLQNDPLNYMIRVADNVDMVKDRVSPFQATEIFKQIYRDFGPGTDTGLVLVELEDCKDLKALLKIKTIREKLAEYGVNTNQDAKGIIKDFKRAMIQKRINDPKYASEVEQYRDKIPEIGMMTNSQSVRHFGGCESVVGVRLKGAVLTVQVDLETYNELNKIKVIEEALDADGVTNKVRVGVGDYQIWRAYEAYRSLNNNGENIQIRIVTGEGSNKRVINQNYKPESV